MSETEQGAGKVGPALKDTVQEVQGYFPNDAALQDALGRLTLAGYDRADFSLPEEQPERQAMPDSGAENPTDDIDKAQVRTMSTGMMGFAGAAAAAGVTIATGGAAALAAGVAAAAAAGAGAATSAVSHAADQAAVDERNRRGAAGTLILAVRTRTPEAVQQVSALLREAGAGRVEAVTRTDEVLTRGVSSAAWTGG